jgi:large subunit ribosomal protein L14e
MIEVGRLCLKIAGREAGRYCIVVKKMDENFVMVTGPRELTSVKRRRCNINHLEPIMETLNIKSDAPDSEILKAYQQANLIKKLGLEPNVKAAKAEKRAAEREGKARKEGPPPSKAKHPERKAGKGERKKEKKPVKKGPAKKAEKRDVKKSKKHAKAAKKSKK